MHALRTHRKLQVYKFYLLLKEELLHDGNVVCAHSACYKALFKVFKGIQVCENTTAVMMFRVYTLYNSIFLNIY